MINETIKRLVNPEGPGYRIMSALSSLGEAGNGRPRAVRVADLATMAGLPEDVVQDLVPEMAKAEIVRTSEGYVWLWWLGEYWLEELEELRLLAAARLLGVPMAGVASRDIGREATISLTFTVGSMWALIDALDRAMAASGPADQERLAAMRVTLQRHQEHLLLVAEGDDEPGPYSVHDAEMPVPAWCVLRSPAPAGHC
jgi:DNA-binding IscR family transcriptional regulator